MIHFLINSTLSLAVLLAVYHLVLEKEKIHQFNRFYLLFCLAFSFAIPFITFEIVQEASTALVKKPIVFATSATMMVIEDDTNYWMIALWIVYGLVTTAFAFRFLSNVYKLINRKRNNPTVAYKNARLVLLDEKILPHTFLNYIFINKDAYHSRKIEAELYAHELIHVTQKHTFDILLIETIRVFFWFNPLFLLYKKAIQLNHEFLADEQVVTTYNNVPFYQNLLLSVANANPTYYLASNLNYAVTKKRLIMMTKKTSASRAILKKGIVIPVVTALLFSLCTKTVAQETTKQTSITDYSNLFKNYYINTTFQIVGQDGTVVATKKYADLTDKEKQLVPALITENIKNPSKKKMDEILTKGGPETFKVDAFSKKTLATEKLAGEPYNSTEVTEKPEFPGGMAEFYKFVGKNYTMSPEMIKEKVKGRVYVTFIIEKDGSLTDYRIIREIGYGTGEETIRVLKLSPKWIPGKFNDVAVKTMYSLPITISAI